MGEAAIAQRDIDFVRANVVGLVGVGMMWLSIAATLPMTLGNSQPQLVLALWPTAAVARTASALKLVSSTRPQAHEALTLAGKALAREPILAAAASTLGAASILDGNERRAEKAFIYAERLSRRDLQTQLWFIEHAVRQGDVAGALGHYDVALRANPLSVGTALLPIMARASSNATVRRPLIALLRKRPSWWLPYLNTMLTASLPPIAIAEQLSGARLDPTDPVQATILSNGLTQLAQATQYRLAYAALPSANRGLQNGSFEKAPSLLPFDWWLATDDDLSAYREPDSIGDGAYILRIASKDRDGVAAQQLMVLPAGRYGLNWVSGGAVGGATPSIAVACAENRVRPLAKTMLIAPTGVTRRFSLPFTIPAQRCEAQWISITTTTTASIAGWMDALELQQRPANND